MKIHEMIAAISVKDAKAAIEFYTHVFGATEKYRLVEPSGRIGHAELDFGTTLVMLADEYPELGYVGPDKYGGTAVTLNLHVDDCDAVIARAVEAGAKLERAPSDAFYGRRAGTIFDPFGHRWSISHEIEALSPEELQRRYDELLKSG